MESAAGRLGGSRGILVIGLIILGSSIAVFLITTSLVSGMGGCLLYGSIIYEPGKTETLECQYSRFVGQDITFNGAIYSGTGSGPVAAPARLQISDPDGQILHDSEFVTRATVSVRPEEFGIYKAILTFPAEVEVDVRSSYITYQFGFVGPGSDLVSILRYVVVIPLGLGGLGITIYGAYKIRKKKSVNYGT